MINLRLFRRTLEDIILLWSTVKLKEEEKTKIKIYVDMERSKEVKRWEEIKFSSLLKDEKAKVDKNTAIAVISCEENGLNINEEYLFKITLGEKENKIEEEILIFPFGVLPDEEKDDVVKNSHLFGFVKGRGKWKKVPLIEYQGIFSIPVYIVNLKEKNK